MNPFIQIPNQYKKETVEKQNVVPLRDKSKEEPDTDRYLTPVDRLELQLAFEKGRSSKFEIDALSQRMTALRALIQNYELRLPQLKTELETLATDLEEKKTVLAETGTAMANVRTQIAKKYELVGKWNFDEETGKIKC